MAINPPAMSATARLLTLLVERTSHIGRPKAWLYTFLALVATAGLDMATGPGVSLSFAYLLVTCFAAWCLRERAGFVVAIAGVASTLLINGPKFAIPGGVQHAGLGLMIWNVFGRLCSLFLLVAVVSGFRHTLELERWRASTDGLTGVLNKAAFRSRMSAAIAAAKRQHAAIILAYMDLDGFKHVNDSAGHSAGDHVLRDFASAAANNIRARDLFARIGGDEFIALMIVPDCATGDGVAENLHHRLTTILAGTGFAVSCSMGAVILDAAAVEKEDDLIELADTLMYEVKRSGKNALRIAHGPSAPAPLALSLVDADGTLRGVSRKTDRPFARSRSAA